LSSRPKNWLKGLQGNSKPSEPLKYHTTFKIGGPARFFIEPKDTVDLKLLISAAKRYKIKISLIGAGSNILASDKGVNAAVVHLGAPYFKRLAFKKNIVEAGAGVPLSRLVNSAARQGLTGLEFLAGIPATVGGALAMNAGAWGKSIGRTVRDVTVMDYAGTIKTLPKGKIHFDYRASGLGRCIILSVRLTLAKENECLVRERIAKFLCRRRLTQDLSRPSAGCVFKNPGERSAGRLIDRCGLKGMHRGGALVSPKHANFIVNTGGARCVDVLALIRRAQKEVKKRFQVLLKPEIRIWS